MGYAALGQAGGWLLGPALGYRPFSFHIAGTVFGCSVPPSVGELGTWAIYNFAVFAVAPFLWFRRRYSATQLNLRSTDRKNDLLVIVVVMVIESLVELSAFPEIFQLSAHQILIAAPLAFGVFMIGTVLPTMVLIYAILVPRYLKLTGSSPYGYSGRRHLRGHAHRRRMVGIQHPAGHRAVADLCRSAIFRSRHDQDGHHPAHRQRLGPRHRLPCDRATRYGRYPIDSQSLRSR